MNKYLALDIETDDPLLLQLGDGAIRKDGQILMCCTHDGEETRVCRPGTLSWDWLREQLADPKIDKIAHNGVYDYNWLQNGYNMQINGTMHDTLTRSGLINEYEGAYDLDSCCKRFNVVGKNYTDTVDSWWKLQGYKGKAISNLALIPFNIVAKYCEQDVEATYELFRAQENDIIKQGLSHIYDIECQQYPFILRMKKNGIKIDVPKLEQLTWTRSQDLKILTDQLEKQYGITSLTIKSGPGSIVDACTRLGILDQLSLSENGKPSISSESLNNLKHPIKDLIQKAKVISTLLSKYLEGAFEECRIGDRIHGTLKPTLRDDGGTTTGRYASSNPNMQNFTSREKKGGKDIKSLFIPDDDHYMGSYDYKQIEYKVFSHYATGPGSQELIYNMQHDVDYHKLIQDMLGWTSPDARNIVKTLNFGVAYGRGLGSIIRGLGPEVQSQATAANMTVTDYITDFYNKYHARLPFIWPTRRAIEHRSERDGGMRSVGGRFHHIPPDGKVFKMVAYVCQGGAADVFKTGMADAWNSGVFEVLRPHIPIHDELVFSVPKNKEGAEACKELQRCMEQCVELKVPIKVDPGLGLNWWDAKEGNESIRSYYEDLLGV